MEKVNNNFVNKIKTLRKTDERKFQILDNLYHNVYFTPDKKEVIFYNDDFYYLSADGLKITQKIYRI